MYIDFHFNHRTSFSRRILSTLSISSKMIRFKIKYLAGLV